MTTLDTMMTLGWIFIVTFTAAGCYIIYSANKVNREYRDNLINDDKEYSEDSDE